MPPTTPVRLFANGELVSTNDPLPVALSGAGGAGSLDAGEEHIGQVGGETTLAEVTLSLDTSAYASGDVLAATQEVANAVRVNGGTGVLQSVVVVDKDNQAQGIDIVVFGSNVALGTENAAVSLTANNAVEIQAIVSIEAADYVNLVNSRVAEATNLGRVVAAEAGSTSLYVGVVSRGTGTYSASGVVLKLGLLLD